MLCVTLQLERISILCLGKDSSILVTSYILSSCHVIIGFWFRKSDSNILTDFLDSWNTCENAPARNKCHQLQFSEEYNSRVTRRLKRSRCDVLDRARDAVYGIALVHEEAIFWSVLNAPSLQSRSIIGSQIRGRRFTARQSRKFRSRDNLYQC